MKFAILGLNRRDYHGWKALGEVVAPSTLETGSERPCGATGELFSLFPSRPDLPKSALLLHMPPHAAATNTHAIGVDTA